MRLTMTLEEFNKVINVLANSNEEELIQMMINKKIHYEKSLTTKKFLATENAQKAKIEKAKKSILSSIEIMQINNDKINVNTVSKHSGLAYNTVKKYKYLITNRI